MMGDTGPCGPCSEIFYDHGPDVAGGPPGSPGEDGDRYIEIWNNVFMQFNRTEDGVLHPLPKPSVDTGMGLERLSAVLQHVHSNYEIDLFVALLAAAKTAADAAGAGDCDASSPSLKVIADHIRACSFTIADGVIPGNEGRGYVLRRIARRGIRHGYKLGARRPFFYTLVPALVAEMGEAYPELRRDAARITDVLRRIARRGIRHGYKLGARRPFFYTLVPALVAEMGEAYPELRRDAARITDVLRTEEERFFQTISHGMEILEAALSGIEGLPDAQIDGDTAFKLHDTFGFPLDLTADVCRERGVKVDAAGFDRAMNRQREQARASAKFKVAAGLEYTGGASAFHGYEHLVCEHSKVTAIYLEGSSVQRARAGDDVVLVLDHTPFYAESGGQVGDVGELRNARSRVVVEDTVKVQAAVHGHQGRVIEGEVEVGDVFVARVDAAQRARTARNHSVTHLMHKALREVLGAHVQQKGSLVNAERTRFDFAHNAPVTDAQVAQVEAIVNAEILANAPATAQVLPIEEAQKLGAMMLFGEKYGAEVRVLDIGSSRELCGGTHVQRTGDIGLFKIVGESGVAAGIRRVEAVTGLNALAYVQQLEGSVNGLAGSLKVTPHEVPARVASVLEQLRALEKEIGALKGRLASAQGDELLAQAVEVSGGGGSARVLAAVLKGADAKALRETLDKLKDKLKSAAVVLAAVDGDKVQLAAGVTADLTGRVKAGELVNFVAQQVGGKGGGKADMAMAGGTDPTQLPAALASVAAWVQARV
jgi:alanyl-tRNA synthetase